MDFPADRVVHPMEDFAIPPTTSGAGSCRSSFGCGTSRSGGIWSRQRGLASPSPWPATTATSQTRPARGDVGRVPPLHRLVARGRAHQRVHPLGGGNRRGRSPQTPVASPSAPGLNPERKGYIQKVIGNPSLTIKSVQCLAPSLKNPRNVEPELSRNIPA
jgi:hypothetical protein